MLHSILWRNPPEFENTPYLIRIRELSISFNPWTLITFKKSSNNSSNSSNSGNNNSSSNNSNSSSSSSSSSSGKSELKGIEFDTIIIDGFEWYFEKAHTDTTVFSLNIWAAIGATDKDSEKNILRSIIMGIWKAIRVRIGMCTITRSHALYV